MHTAKMMHSWLYIMQGSILFSKLLNHRSGNAILQILLDSLVCQAILLCELYLTCTTRDNSKENIALIACK
jgi:hypothetical protein